MFWSHVTFINALRLLFLFIVEVSFVFLSTSINTTQCLCAGFSNLGLRFNRETLQSDDLTRNESHDKIILKEEAKHFRKAASHKAHAKNLLLGTALPLFLSAGALNLQMIPRCDPLLFCEILG